MTVVRGLRRRVLSEKHLAAIADRTTRAADRASAVPEVVRRPIRRAAAARMISLAARDPIWQERTRVWSYRRWVRSLAVDATEHTNREGFDLVLDLNDNVQRCLFFTGTYETEYLRFLEGEVHQGDTYIDIGGHIGLDALIVARRLKYLGAGQVFVFEPSADSAAKIAANVRNNDLADLIQLIECGLGEVNGKIDLRADPDFHANDAGVRSKYNSGAIVATAPLRRFDDWVRETGLDRMDVVKLDIEGSELEALRGMAHSLKGLAPRSVVVEVGATRLRQAGTDASQIDEVLDSCGYRRSGETFLENVVYRPDDRA